MPSNVSLTETAVPCQYANPKQGFSHWDDCCLSIRSCQARFFSLGRLLLVNTRLPSKVSLNGTAVACQYAAANHGFSQWDDCCLPIRICQARFLSPGRQLLVDAQLPSKVSLIETTVACQYTAANQGFSHWDDCCLPLHSFQSRFLSQGRLLLVNTHMPCKVSLIEMIVAFQYTAANQGFSHWDDCCLPIHCFQSRFLSLGVLLLVNTQLPSKVFLTGTTVPCQYANAKQGFSHWDDCCLSIRSCQGKFFSLGRLLLVNTQLPSKVSLIGTAVPCQYAIAKQVFSH